MAEPLTPARLVEIRSRVDACFRAPWTARPFEVVCDGGSCELDGHDDCDEEHEVQRVEAPEEYPVDPEDPQVVCDVYGLDCFAKPHAAFMAAARQDVPDLLDALEAAYRRIAELEGRTP